MTRGGEIRDRAFYVGYRGLPRAHAVFLAVAVPLSLLGMVVGAWGLAWSQGGWGTGYWQTGAAAEFRGTLALEPYPMLHASDGAGGVETYLLVEMGKFGSADRFAMAPGVEGASVVVRGRELHRDGRRMIEIDPDSDALGPAWRVDESAGPAVRAALVAGGERVELVGEVVDSKCYLGAMKPGAGRGHKSCATLCIDGGIPPVLVTFDDVEGGVGARYHLLAGPGGGALGESDLAALRPLIGERVVLSGRAGSVGSWRVLFVDGLASGGGGVVSASP